MIIVLRVMEGPEQGRVFRFQEAENLLVGRQDATSRAQLNISGDPAVSRHHFTLEVRPPNLMLRDNHSRNGTFVRRRGTTLDSPWERIDETLIYDGDQIKLGVTVLAVAVQATEPPVEPPATAPAPAEPGDHPRARVGGEERRARRRDPARPRDHARRPGYPLRRRASPLSGAPGHAPTRSR